LKVTFFFVGITLVLGASAFFAWLFPQTPPQAHIQSGIFGCLVLLGYSISQGINITGAIWSLLASIVVLSIRRILVKYYN